MNNARPAVSPLKEVSRPTAHGTLAALARSGDGAPLVVLHGVMANARAWTDVVDALMPGRPALVPNRRGRRPSAAVATGYSLDTEVEDLAGWLATFSEPVDLVAHSYGGLIALEAARRGAAVRSLVLYEPVARPFGVEALAKLVAAIERDDLDAAVEIINVDVSGYTHEHVDTLRNSPVWPTLLELAEPAGAELTAIEAFPFDPATYAALAQPITLIAGELSRHRAPYGPSVDRFRHALALDEVVILDGQDHLAHVTAPLELANAIADALPAID